MIALGTLTALSVLLGLGTLVVEGVVIARCVRAATPTGGVALTRLGAGFLASEVWTIALLGTTHGAFPGAWHAAVPWIAAPLTLAVAGWMLRDVGLWLGPRLGAGRGWRWIVAAGATVQGLGLVAALAALCLAWITGDVPAPGSAMGAASETALAMLALTLPTGVALVVALQLAWWRLLGGVRVPWFTWHASAR